MAGVGRRYKQDPSTGKMAGSVPTVVNPPIIDNPWTQDPVLTDVSGKAEPGYTEIFAAFDKVKMPEQFDAEAFPARFLDSDHPVAKEVAAAFVDFDAEQQEYAIADQLGLVKNRIYKSPGIFAHGPADTEEWKWWCNQQAERVQEDNPDLASQYRELGASGPPTNYEFAYLVSGRAHAKSVAKSYDREMRYLAGYHGSDPADIRLAVEAERIRYMGIDDREKPQVPSWFTDGLESSYWGKDRSRRPPLDEATKWGLYSVLVNPDSERIARNSDTREYVVFDTETTGLSNNAAIVQITAIRYSASGEEQERISTYLKPNDSSVFDTEEAQKAGEITGITYETVKSSPTFGEVAPQLREMMAGRTLVAHNLMFDYPRVQRAFAEDEGSALAREERTLPMGPIVDTLRLARWVQPNPGVPRKDWKHTLEQACRRAKIAFDPDEAHDALYDVERTNELFRHLRDAPLGGESK